MPHLTLEYSANITDHIDTEALFVELHHALAVAGDFRVQDFKSRIFPAAQFFVGTGDANQSFVNLTICTFAGKSREKKKLITEAALPILAQHFSNALTNTNCDISVQITELEREVFSRIRSTEISEEVL